MEKGGREEEVWGKGGMEEGGLYEAKRGKGGWYRVRKNKREEEGIKCLTFSATGGKEVLLVLLNKGPQVGRQCTSFTRQLLTPHRCLPQRQLVNSELQNRQLQLKQYIIQY